MQIGLEPRGCRKARGALPLLSSMVTRKSSEKTKSPKKTYVKVKVILEQEVPADTFQAYLEEDYEYHDHATKATDAKSAMEILERLAEYEGTDLYQQLGDLDLFYKKGEYSWQIDITDVA